MSGGRNEAKVENVNISWKTENDTVIVFTEEALNTLKEKVRVYDLSRVTNDAIPIRVSTRVKTSIFTSETQDVEMPYVISENRVEISEDIKDDNFDFQLVNSSAMHGIGYDKITHSLLIQFDNGRRYIYQDVPEEVYNTLMGAESKGNAFNLMIQGNYTCKGI